MAPTPRKDFDPPFYQRAEAGDGYGSDLENAAEHEQLRRFVGLKLCMTIGICRADLNRIPDFPR